MADASDGRVREPRLGSILARAAWSTHAKAVGIVGLGIAGYLALRLTFPRWGVLELVTLSAFFVWMGWTGLRGGVERIRDRQLVRNTPTSEIRSLAVGDVEVKGRARPLEEPVASPLTRTRACLYVLTVEELRSSDDGAEWVRVLDHSDHVPFELDDGTGRVLVAADEADLDLRVERQVRVPADRAPPQPLRAWAKRQGYVDRREDSDGPLEAIGDALGLDPDPGMGELLARARPVDRRFTERVLAVDEGAYVFGAAEPREEVESTENAENLAICRHDGTGRFIVSDRPETEIEARKLLSVARAFAVALASFALAVEGFGRLFGVF